MGAVASARSLLVAAQSRCLLSRESATISMGSARAYEAVAYPSPCRAFNLDPHWPEALESILNGERASRRSLCAVSASGKTIAAGYCKRFGAVGIESTRFRRRSSEVEPISQRLPVKRPPSCET